MNEQRWTHRIDKAHLPTIQAENPQQLVAVQAHPREKTSGNPGGIPPG